MAFTKQARDRLQKFVRVARKIIEDDFLDQLQSIYGMDPTEGANKAGANLCITELSHLQHLNTTQFETASDLREIYAHYLAQNRTVGDTNEKTPLNRILREQTQTALYRLCAIRMAEERGVLQPALSAGMRSAGFENYKMVVGSALGSQFDAYEKFLKSIFDELAQDLPQLFDRTLPYGLLFPREKALMALLDEINASDLAASGQEKSFWAEDETIGWIFQYFNNEADFAIMRGQKNVNPKNSHELAVRNQFFTPRYVVEFLVDNTLGRRWAQETQGNTRLITLCQSLIWKDGIGEMPSRLRDPRSLKVLDPACGSMHFGLYAFDVLEHIYEECWDWIAQDASRRLVDVPDGLLSLQNAYDSKEAFLQDLPRLILTYNLFGVDIDVRATQIASLALWLRAQRSLQEQGIPAEKRPRLGAGNVVAAVAPPPEKDLSLKLESTLGRRALAGFKALSLDFLRLIPETGVLLPLEDSLRSVEEALQQQGEQGSLFGDDIGQQFSLKLETAVWEDQRDAVQAALSQYINEAGHAFDEQLFARDAAQCLRMIDLCTMKFDVVVMNPPFGSPTDGSRETLGRLYPSTKKEIIGMFILRMLKMLAPRGFIGAISSRTLFFQGSSSKWREEVLFGHSCMPIFLDLGLNVMDNALVESAAYVLGSGISEADTIFINATGIDRSGTITDYLQRENNHILKKLQSFKTAPEGALVYFAKDDVLSVYGRTDCSYVDAKQGLATGDNNRFVRLAWETESASKNWVPLAKGGEARPFYGDVPTEIKWRHSGEEVASFDGAVIRNRNFYFRPGLTWSFRANALCLRAFPKEGIFEHVGNCVFIENDAPLQLLATLAILNSRTFQNLIGLRLQRLVADSRYECGMLSSTPFPKMSQEDQDLLARWATQNFEARRKLDSVNEESRAFLLPEVIQTANEELDRHTEICLIAETQEKMDAKADALYGLQSQIIEKQEKSRLLPTPSATELRDRLVSWAVGVAFGRFDWRLALGEREIPSFGEPFDPYPERAPGRLPDGVEPLIPNQGIFVNDPSHEKDLTRAVRTVFTTCYLDDNIDVKSWIEKNFFKFHLGIYSAAQRVAPIYWPIGTSSGDYVLWLYYPKLSSSMLYAVLNEFVEPKLKFETQQYTLMQQESQTRTAAKLREFEKKASFITELTVFRDKIRELADHFTVHFDDGVAINAVRFMPIIQSKAWLKSLEKTKAALEAGDLDWSETAADLYPERVKQACRKNPSIRLAHQNRGWFDDETDKGAVQ